MNSQPRKILFLAPSLSGGGAQRVLSTLLRHLDRDRFVLHLGLLQRSGPYLEDIPSDVVIHDLKVSRVRFALPGIVRLVWSVKPHAVLSTLSHLNAFLILFRFLLPRSTRLLVRETTTASVMFLQQNPHNPRIWHWLYRRFYKNADRIVCLSDAMVSDLVSHFAIPQENLSASTTLWTSNEFTHWPAFSIVPTAVQVLTWLRRGGSPRKGFRHYYGRDALRSCSLPGCMSHNSGRGGFARSIDRPRAPAWHQ